MDAIELFQDHFGIKGVGVKFYNDEIDMSNFQILRDIRFCQAVRIARDQRVFLDKDSIICKGARYALGFEDEAKEEIVVNGHDRMYQIWSLKSVPAESNSG